MADFDYLTRRLDRIADDALVEAQKAVMEIQADATRKGALGNSRVYLFYDEAIGKTLKSTLERLTSVAFSVCGETTEEAAKAVETSAFKFVDAATTWLERKFKTEGAAFGFSGPPIETLRATLLKMVDDGVDDFRHGMSGDTRLKKDPLVSVVSTITNSPNAIQQTALGDSNQLSIQQQAPALLNAVNELLKSPEAKSLNEQKRLALEDTADALRNELGKSSADSAKVHRWAHRLAELAREFGMHAAAAVFAKVALTALGVHF